MTPQTPCPECRGAGFFYHDSGPSGDKSQCEDCHGTGTVDADDDETPPLPRVAAMKRTGMTTSGIIDMLSSGETDNMRWLRERSDRIARAHAETFGGAS
jgi:hypothetical protein